MGYCEKCGSYVPIDETTCPACGFDPTQQGFESGRYATQTQSQYAAQGQYAYQAGSDTGDKSEPWNRPQDRDPWDRESGDSSRRRRSTGAGKQKTTGSAGRSTQHQAHVYSSEAGDYRHLSILSYFGILFLIPLFMHRESAYVRFHANQGLLLFLAELLVQFTTRYFPVLGGLVGTVGGIFCLVCFFKGVSSAAKGRMDKLPVIGDITLIR